MTYTDEQDLYHLDAVQNSATGIGTMADKRNAARFVVPQLSKNDMLDVYESNDLAARIVDIFPDHMTREGFEICVDNDKELSEDINTHIADMGIADLLRECMIKMRLFGGCAILIGANDGTSNLELPLDMENIRSVDYFTVLDRFECVPVELYENPAAPNFRKPKFYEIRPEGIIASSNILQKIHESRLLIMSMPFASHMRSRHGGAPVGGWGNSVLLRIFDILRDYDQVWGGVSHAMTTFVQTIYSLTDLSDKLNPRPDAAADRDLMRERKRGLQTRIAQLNYYSSSVNALLIDKEREGFERKSTVLSGVPETLDRYVVRVSAASEVPVTVLFGTSPNGLNATGAADTRFFYDTVKTKQRNFLAPFIKKLVAILTANKSGVTGGVQLEKYSIRFKPLWQMSDAEIADFKLKVSLSDEKYINMGIVTKKEIRESRFGSDEYSADTHIGDLDAIDDIEQPAVSSGQSPSENPAQGNVGSSENKS